MKSKKSEKRKESATPKWNYTGFAEIRQCPVYDSGRYTSVTYFTPKCTGTKWRGTVFVHQFQLMSLETFQAVKFGGSKGVPRGERSELGRRRGAGRWRTVVAKRASRRRVGRSGQAT